MISLQNFEEYFVRYLDDELSLRERGEVEAFLQEHPELQSELDAFRATILPADDSEIFYGKEMLMRGVTLSNYEDYFIRKIENDLSPSDEKQLSEFLQSNPQLQREMNAYRATRVVADQSISFPAKNKLLKKEPRVVSLTARYIVASAIAASLLLIFMMKGIEWQSSDPVNTVAEQPVVNSNQNSETERIPLGSNSVTTVVAAPNENLSPVAAEKNSVRKNPQYASAHVPAPANNQSDTEFASAGMADMNYLAVDLNNGINYQTRVKKAKYKAISASDETEPKYSSSAFASLATGIGGQFLRLTGREDLAAGIKGFSTQDKNPLTVSIDGGKFGFHHSFFKKRAERNNDSSNQNSTGI